MNELTKLIRKSRRRLRSSIVRAAVQTALRIVEDSPYYAGQLQASTNIGLNAPDLSVVEAANYRADAIQGTVPAAKRQFDRVMKGFKLGDTIYISNNLPYAAIQEFKFGHLMFSSGARQFPAVLRKATGAS